ncbi:MAG TPA: hypothetical protein VKB88_35305 [Bryobacteraceae bacterium]|nr:hypothetical protein [Bryobacteraceae bacterium]
MNSRGEIRIDPGSLEHSDGGAVLHLVIVYSEPQLTAAVLERAAELVSGLNAEVLLVAVHTIPFPASLASASSSHAHLVMQLAELAAESELPVTPQIVMTRYPEEGFRFALREQSTVLMGTRKHFWPTREERLAKILARDGHHVVLLRVEMPHDR